MALVAFTLSVVIAFAGCLGSRRPTRHRLMRGTRVSRTTTILLYMLVGALVGAVTASLVVPPFLTWYNQPGAINAGKQVETLCNIPELIHYTSSRLLRGQLVGAVIGALVGLVSALMRSRHRPSGGLPLSA